MHDLDHFRAPLTDDELRKRNQETLSVCQRESLLSLGYPYIGPDYRFHMTLSGVVPDAAGVADTLAEVMANDIGTAHLKVDALVLFSQESPSERFRVIRRLPLKTGQFSAGKPLHIQPISLASNTSF